MRAMRIVLFGDGAWASRSLVALAEAGHDVAAVVLRARASDTSLQLEARRREIPCFRPDRPGDEAFRSQLVAMWPELALSIAYDRILPPALLAAVGGGFVNFHAGALPRYRGRNVVNWAIINGETEIGLTAHRIDPGIDTGDILLQRMLPIGWTDTYADVLGRVVEAMPGLVLDTITGLSTGALVPRPQAAELATYYSGRVDGDEWLDWSDSSRNLYNKIRGISRPGPGARTLLGDRMVTVWRAAYQPSWPEYRATPGEVVGSRPDGRLIKTGDSTLLVQEVALEDGGPIPPQWCIGTRLGLNAGTCLSDLLARVRRLERRAAEGRESHVVS